MVEFSSAEAHLRTSSTAAPRSSVSPPVAPTMVSTPARDVTVVAPNDAVPVVTRFSLTKSMSPPEAVIIPSQPLKLIDGVFAPVNTIST